MKQKGFQKFWPLLLLVIAVAFSAAGISYAWHVTKEYRTRLVIWEAPESMHVASDSEMSDNTENARAMDLALSPWVSCMVNGYETPVYETNVSNTHIDSAATPTQSRTPIVYFDFDGICHVVIDVTTPEVASAEVHPLSAGIITTVENGRVSFTLEEPGYYTVLFNGEYERSMHFFTHFPEEDEDIPDFEDPDIIYYGPGEYNADTIDVPSGKTLYISGGAVIHGNIAVGGASDVHLMGRGIIDGSSYGGDANNRMVRIPVNISESQNVTLEGLLFLNSNGWVCQGYSSENVTISDIGIISSRANGDGITLQSCRNVDVSHLFVRTWDDSLVVKNYAGSSDNISFRDIIIWTDLAQSMEIGYETNKGAIENAEISNIHFDGITVLTNLHKPVISIHNGDNCLVHDVTYKNITVENADMQYGNTLVEFTVVESGWSTTAERGDIQDISIDGLIVLSKESSNPLIAKVSGYGRSHYTSNVVFGNVEICGEKVIDAMGPLSFQVDEKNTSSITIRAGK